MALPVLLLAYAAFVSLGLPDTVLGVAWPSLRATFDLSQAAMGGVLVAGVTGYLASGLLAGSAQAAVGVGGVLATSAGLVAAGLAGHALAPSWPLFVGSAVLVGLGSGAVDAALNSYAAAHFRPRHMNWLHACYGIGALLGPAAMTAALVSADFRKGYAALGVALAAMALAFAATRRGWERGGAPRAAGMSASSALRLPGVWLQMALFFAYTGVEATAGQWAFTVLRARGFGIESAGALTTLYWGALAAGRIALGFAVGTAGPERLVRAGTLGALAGAGAYALLPGAAGAAALILLGAALAPVFPMLMAQTPGRLGAAAAPHAVGFQVAAATLGTAVFPSLHGALADRAGVDALPFGVAALAAVVVGLVLLRDRVVPAPD